ncbi:tetratricopeptide repeat protein [Sulfurimonas sp.]
MKILFVLILFFPFSLFSQSNNTVYTKPQNDKQYKKEKVVVVGFFSVEKHANKTIKLLNNYYIYKEKNNNGIRLCIINLDEKNIHKVLKDVKKIVPDAYIKDINLKVVKKKIKKKKKVIAVGFFTVEKHANKTMKLLNNYYIYKEKNSDGMRLYLINIDEKNIYKVLQNVKKIVPDAYVKNLELNIKEFKPKQVKEKKKEKKKNTKYNFKQNFNINYTNALNAYTQRDFETSYKIFSSIYLNKLSDSKFNFYYGRSAYETGHYEIALAAYERVELEDPTNIRNKLEMARTFFMLKMYKDSEYAFKSVLRNPNLPENIKTSVELSLSKVSKVQQKSFTHANVSLDMIYDSNVNYGSMGDYKYSGIVLPQVSEKEDFATQAFANVTNIYDIGQSGGFAIKNAISLYLKNYLDLDAYNIAYVAYTPSLIYKETKYTAEMLLGKDIMKLGNKSFLSSVFLIPRLEYSHNNTLKSIAYLKYQKKEFKQESLYSLDSNRLELDYGIQSILSPRSYVQGNIARISESRIGGTDVYVNFNEFKFYGVYANQFSSNYGFDLYLQSRMRDYKDFSTGFNSVRADIGGLGSVGFTIKLSPTLRLKLKTSYEYIDSNQDRFTYQKHTASAGIIKTY